MKHLFAVCLTILLLPLGANAQWLTDYNTALKKAQAEDKFILVNFTGSDWCPACIQLRNEIFSKAEFQSFAQQNLVLLEVDFPRRKSLPAAQVAANERLAELFQIEYYPTVFVLNKAGAKLLKTGNVGTARTYIAAIQKLPGFVDRGTGSAPSNPSTFATTSKKAEAPAYTIPPPVIRYDEIALKGISGGRVPMALINNQSFAAGEKAKVKVGDKTVEIQVKEIRDDSVLAHFEGEAEPRELKLKTKDDPKKE